METPIDNMEPIPVPSNGGAQPFLSDEDIKILKENTLKLFNAADQNFFIHQCQITRLHPMANQIWARPEREEMDREGKWKKMIVVCGIQGILSVADRSGVYDGSSPIEWCGKNGEWTDVWLQSEPPFAARATTWRKDHTRPEVSIVRWKAVANTTWDNPRNFWIKMPDFMIGKCALAASLRKLFPNLLSGLYESSEISGGVPDMMEIPQSALEADIAAQKTRIAEDAVAQERLKAQGVPVVNQAPGPPRDAVKEVEPVMPADKAKLGKPDYQPGDEPDDIDMTPVDSERPEGWWISVSCDSMGNNYYTGKTVGELSDNLLRQAVEKWVPKVRRKTDPRDDVLELAEALEIAMAQSQRNAAEYEAKQAAKAAEGAQ
jgi:phage recombination protein Bet